jgi:pimeloyl-ACP methyl ester carboxylesterase
MTMVRTVLGVIAGLMTMFVVIMAIEAAAHAVYPPPAGLNPMLADDMARIMMSMPVEAKALVVVSWVVGAFAGGWVAAKIARLHPRIAAVIVAAMVVAGVIGMILQMPAHPLWMSALGLLLPIPAALLGAKLARPRVTLPPESPVP